MNPSKIVSTARSVFLSAVLAPLAMAAPTPDASALQCVKSGTSPLNMSLGLQVEYLLPNDVAGFPSSLVGYGISFEIPLGAIIARIDGAHAAVSNFSMAYSTVSIKVPLETPFVTAFVQAGAHYFAFWGTTDSGNQWGGLLGVGISTALSRSFRFEGTLKGYLQGQSMMAVAIGIQTPL